MLYDMVGDMKWSLVVCSGLLGIIDRDEVLSVSVILLFFLSIVFSRIVMIIVSYSIFSIACVTEEAFAAFFVWEISIWLIHWDWDNWKKNTLYIHQFNAILTLYLCYILYGKMWYWPTHVLSLSKTSFFAALVSAV